jgi:hypothetical protein
VELEEGHNFGEVGDLYVVGSASLGCRSSHAVWADLSHHKRVEHHVSQRSSDLGTGKKQKHMMELLWRERAYCTSFKTSQNAGSPSRVCSSP